MPNKPLKIVIRLKEFPKGVGTMVVLSVAVSGEEVISLATIAAVAGSACKSGAPGWGTIKGINTIRRIDIKNGQYLFILNDFI
jgi:hypothetical protein